MNAALSPERYMGVKLSREQVKRALDAIADCDRFIAKEEPRRADLRPAAVAQHLEFCKQHKLKLIAMLASA